jgi:hypothetical protein
LKVPYFLKQLGSHPVESGEKLILADGHGGDPAEWPDQVNVRQMPAIPQVVETSMVTVPG